jgi:hypothetical protein
MTIQQLSRFRTALKCLFDQATGEPSPVASNVLLFPCHSRPGAVPLPPVTNAPNRYCTTFRRSPCRQPPRQALRPIPLGQREPFNPHNPSTVRAA